MNRAIWMVGAAAVVACASVSSGSAIKVKEFAPVGAGLVESPDADAMTTLKYDETTGNAMFHLVAHDLLPNQVYGVYVETEFGWAFSQAFAFTTNSRGHGHWHTEVGGFFDGNYTAVLYIWDPTVGFPGVPPEERSWLDLTVDEWRAIGSSMP